MYTLNVKKRDLQIKAKKIRKNGMIPCSISDGQKKESILIQLADGEAKKLLKNKGRGGRVSLNCSDGETYNVIIKDFVSSHLDDSIENITFQLLNENEYVNSFVRVILTNREKIQAMVYQSVTEIPYKALPQDLVEKIIIDLTELQRESKLMLKDLSIWSNKNLKFSMKEETLIVNIS